MSGILNSRWLRRLKTRTGIISTLAAVLVGTMFCKLGLWQLSRADEKTSIVQAHEVATGLPPLTSLRAGEMGDIEYVKKILYRRVELTGKFDTNRLFLLDNKIVAGQAGFEVIAPFILVDDSYVLVNLGWIGHNGDRKVNVAAGHLPGSEISLKGVVATPSKGFVLGGTEPAVDPDVEADVENEQWPFTLQFIDYETIAVKLDKIPAVNAVIIAAKGQAGGFTYNFKPVASGASKHLGYAFQWFAMLLALVVLYLYLMIFKKADE